MTGCQFCQFKKVYFVTFRILRAYKERVKRNKVKHWKDVKTMYKIFPLFFVWRDICIGWQNYFICKLFYSHIFFWFTTSSMNVLTRKLCIQQDTLKYPTGMPWNQTVKHRIWFCCPLGGIEKIMRFTNWSKKRQHISLFVKIKCDINQSFGNRWLFTKQKTELQHNLTKAPKNLKNNVRNVSTSYIRSFMCASLWWISSIAAKNCICINLSGFCSKLSLNRELYTFYSIFPKQTNLREEEQRGSVGNSIFVEYCLHVQYTNPARSSAALLRIVMRTVLEVKVFKLHGLAMRCLTLLFCAESHTRFDSCTLNIMIVKMKTNLNSNIL